MAKHEACLNLVREQMELFRRAGFEVWEFPYDPNEPVTLSRFASPHLEGQFEVLWSGRISAYWFKCGRHGVDGDFNILRFPCETEDWPDQVRTLCASLIRDGRDVE